MTRILALALLLIPAAAAAGTPEEAKAGSGDLGLPSITEIRAAASADEGEASVPMPDGAPRVSREQMAAFAKGAARIYEAQGRPWLARWHCMEVSGRFQLSKWMTGVYYCIKPKGSVRDGLFYPSKVELRVEIMREGKRDAFGQSLAKAAEIGRCAVRGDGAIEHKERKFNYTSWHKNFPSDESLVQDQAGYWAAFGQQ